MDRLKNYFIKQNISYTKLNNIIITGYKEINNKNKCILETSFDLLEYFPYWSTKYNLKKITKYYIHNNNFMYYAYIIDAKYYDLLIKEFKLSTMASLIYTIYCYELLLIYFYVPNRKFIDVECCINAKCLIHFNNKFNYI